MIAKMKPFIALLTFFLLSQFSEAAGHDWLDKLDGGQPISTITLPGTHDSGARKEPFPGTARTQSATIAQQLDFGIRLLDIRCRHLNDSFAIYHGIANQDLTFAEVIRQVSGFLEENSSEFVVMSIAETNKAKNNTRSFTQTLDSYLKKDPGRWHLKPEIPSLDSARGKIVLLRRFQRDKIQGIDATNWPNNTTFSKNGLVVQDRYQVEKIDTKWKHITAQFASAVQNRKPNLIHLNFTSGYVSGRFGIPDILKVSDEINARLKKYFERAPRKFHGWIMMDFATAGLSELIYRRNSL
jgi:1-phosphatidylinositol phosphodiesterase